MKFSFLKRNSEKAEKVKKKTKLTLLEILTVIVCLAMLLTTGTYSWLRRMWAPKITQTGMQIMAGESLVFSLIGGNLGQDSTVFLNSVMNLENFVLRPVSNKTGKSNSFFTLNTNSFEHEYFSHIVLAGNETSEGWTAIGLSNGYIEQSFMIQGRDTEETMENYTKYVYLSTDTHVSIYHEITDEDLMKAVNAIRVSLTIGEGDSAVTYLFSDINGVKRTHKAITDVIIDDAWIADGIEYRATDSSEYGTEPDAEGRLRRLFFEVNSDGFHHPLVETVNPNNTHLFSDYMGGFDNGGTTFDPEKILFTISPGQSVKITLRIWLEGEDPDCTSGIKGSQIDFLLGFSSWNVSEGGETTEEETEEEPPP